jgi:hypothetical protein
MLRRVIREIRGQKLRIRQGLELDPVPQGFIRGDRFYICVYLKRKSSLKS